MELNGHESSHCRLTNAGPVVFTRGCTPEADAERLEPGVYTPPTPRMSTIDGRARSETGSITVSVTLFADLRRFLPRGADGPQRYTLARDATMADLLRAIGIEDDADITTALEGELAPRDARLHDGAEIMLLSPMEGGRA